MQIINKTNISDEALTSLFAGIAKAVNVQTSKIIITVTRKRTGQQVSGLAYQFAKDDNDYMKISMPAKISCDKIGMSILIFLVIMHEFAHIKDYQYTRKTGLSKPWSKPIRYRLPKHDLREEEIRADKTVAKILKRKEVIKENMDAITTLMDFL